MSERIAAVPCWEVPVGHTVASDVGALSIDEDPVFLATHVELPIHQHKGGSGLKASVDVFEAFQSEIVANPQQNTVVAVTGPSGSGKSHLVRWVRARLSPTPGDLLVYVPRHVTTLRSTIELVCDQLGGEIAEQVRTQLEKSVGSVTEAQLSSQLTDALCQVLEHEPSTAGVGGADLILPQGDHARRGLPSIMRLEKARDYLLADERTLRRLASSILGLNTGGDQDRPTFSSDDMGFLDLAGMEGALDQQSVRALRFLTRESARSDAVELMNRSVDAAVQRTLGWRDGPSLRNVFGDVRERLGGRQLILMFEDLALVNFIEGAILDEFANHGSDTRAALRVMFAVTDDKYTALAETIEGRVTSRFTVGAVPLADADEGALAVREEFIARHLNLARVGRSKVLDAAAANDPLPVQCAVCRSQDDCFAGFGSVPIDVGGGRVESVGLFPYNRIALRRAFAALESQRRRDNRRVTARAAIDHIVIRGLDVSHDALTSNAMPSAAVASIVDDNVYTQAKEDVLQGAEALDESTRDRIYRTRVFWMDENVETAEVAEAFGLPDLVTGLTVTGVVRPPVPPPTPPPRPQGGEPPTFLQEVLRWVNSDSAEGDLDAKADEAVRSMFERIVRGRIDLRPHLVAPAQPETKRLLGVVLGRNSFSLGGSGRQEKGKLRFELPRNTDTYRLVVGAAWLDANGHWDFDPDGAKWSLPQLSDRWSLPVEVEAFLSTCVSAVEGAVVAAVIGGQDPATVAYQLRKRAAAAAVTDAPPAWRFVVDHASAVRADMVVGDTIISLAGATGPSSRADVAALDAARLESPDGLTSDFAPLDEHFAHLAGLARQFNSAVRDARPTLARQAEAASALLAEHVGDNDLKTLATDAHAAGIAANNEGFFRPSDRYPQFVEACLRLAKAPWPRKAPALAQAESGSESDRIADVARLLSIAGDVEVLAACLQHTDDAGRAMLSVAAGGLDPSQMEETLKGAALRLVGALRNLATEARK